MHIQGTDYALVALNLSEIETIISALESDWYNWSIEEAGILLSQFKQLKKQLEQSTKFINDSE